MEQLSNSEMSAYADGMRAAKSHSEDTYRVVAVLKAIENDLPKKVSINGADIRKLVADLEARGVIIPGRPVSDVEVRNLRSKVAVEMPKITLRGIPFKGKQTSTTYDAAKDIDFKYKQQEYEFELMLMAQGDSREKLQARIDEAKDPLMKIVNRNNKK